MGYRSDVKYVLLFKTKENRTKALALAHLAFSDLDDGQNILDAMRSKDSHKNDEWPYHIVVHHEDVKWYSGAWTEAQVDFLSGFNDRDGQHVFMRIGEEDDDIETLASDEVYVSDYILYSRYSEFCYN